MQENKNNQNQDNKIQKQDQKFSEQKNQAPVEKSKLVVPEKNDDDGDEDENHYNDSIEKE